MLITPGERHELAALKDAGFTGYLVKPIRAASLAARFAAEDSFEHRRTDAAGELSQAGEPRANGKCLSILVAEDNEINALLARALLTRLGHRPTIVGDGLAAVHAWIGRARGRQPLRRGADGRADARHRRARGGAPHPRRRGGSWHTAHAHLALTANAQAEDREACLAAGMDGFLVKPLDRERLREALEGLSPNASATLAA